MKNTLLLTAALLTGLISFAQGTKVISDKNAQLRTLHGFHAIQISSGIDLYLNQSNEESVAVSGSEPEHRDKIITEVGGGVLRIPLPENQGLHWGGHGNWHLKAYVSCKLLDE